MGMCHWAFDLTMFQLIYTRLVAILVYGLVPPAKYDKVYIWCCDFNIDSFNQKKIGITDLCCMKNNLCVNVKSFYEVKLLVYSALIAVL